MHKIPEDHPVERIISAFNSPGDLVFMCAHTVPNCGIDRDMIYQWRQKRQIPPKHGLTLAYVAQQNGADISMTDLLRATGLKTR